MRAPATSSSLPWMSTTPLPRHWPRWAHPTEQDRVWVGAEIARSIERGPARPEAAARHQAAAFRLGWPGLDSLASIEGPYSPSTALAIDHYPRRTPKPLSAKYRMPTRNTSTEWVISRR